MYNYLSTKYTGTRYPMTNQLNYTSKIYTGPLLKHPFGSIYNSGSQEHRATKSWDLGHAVDDYSSPLMSHSFPRIWQCRRK